MGRAGEVAQMRAALAALRAGNGSILVVTGEPGIGKTRLLSELGALARPDGIRVLEGHGTEFEQDVPFGLFQEVIDGDTADLLARRLVELGDQRVAELAQVFPVLADRFPHRRLASIVQAERYLAHRAVRALLQALATDGPIVLLLDDLHWADEASIELVSYLLRHPPQAAVLIALSYRDHVAPPRLAAAAAAAERDGTAIALRLAPLSDADADALVAVVRAPTGGQEIAYRLSGGNPFYLIELARTAWRESPRPLFPSPASSPDTELVPDTVLAVIEHELRGLSPSAALLARTAAVVGEPFEFGLVAEIAGLPENEAVDALDELLDGAVITPIGSPREFRFRHPIVRSAVYVGAGEGWRIAAHGRAAVALERHGAHVTRLAHHIERSARWGDARAIEVLTLAGHAVAARAPAAAASWFAAALRLLPADAPAEHRLALLVPLASALAAIGANDDAGARLHEAYELVPPELAVARGRIVGAMAQLDHMVGRHGEPRRLLERALDAVGSSLSPARAALYLELAVDHWLASEWDELARRAEPALADATELGEPLLHATAAAMLALGRYYADDTTGGIRRLEEAGQLVDSDVPDDALQQRLECTLCLGHAELLMERFADSVRHLQRGLDISRATGQAGWFFLCLCLRGVSDMWLGHLDDAAWAADTALESAFLGQKQLLLWAWTLRSWVQTVQGQLEDAVHSGEQAAAVAAEAPGFLYAWLAPCTLAAALIETGEPERGRRDILAHAGGERLEVIELAWRPRWYELLARADLQVGDLGAAERWVQLAERAAAPVSLAGRTGEAARARAALELARGDLKGAASHAQRAADSFARVDRVIDAAVASIIGARALAAGGDRARAVSELQRAHADLDERGAVGYRDQARRALKELDARLPRRAHHRQRADGAAQLSSREWEVAALVARGLTNRQIGEQLYLTEKTIETHMTRIFAKLEVSSRAEVAAAFARMQTDIGGDDVRPVVG